METSLIEQLDKSRYNLLKWTTIGWAIWFATIIGNNFEKGHFLITVAYWVGVLGSIIFVINLIKYLKLKRILIWNAKLNEALNNELHVFNLHKSFQLGYWTVIITTCILMFISNFTSISGLLVSEIILYLGVLSVLISGLYYNRD